MDLAANRPVATGDVKAERVLVFLVDDGLFSVHLDWVEAVYETRAVDRHRVRVEKGPWQHFLLHRGEPALIVDLREAFDLTGVLGETERAAYVVIQSGGYKLAIAIDQVSGVQDLELDAHSPVPSSLVRDGGIPVGHVVQLDDRMVVVLDPHRLLSGARRDALEPVWTRAKAYAQRDRQMSEVWSEVCNTPSAENVRVFGRLCGRNGRPKAAAAARAVVKAYADLESGADSGPSLAERLTAEIVRRAGAGQTGSIDIDGADGAQIGCVFVAGGRVIDAQQGAEWGRMALKSILAHDAGRVAFVERDLGQHPERISESSAALLISSMEAVALEQRKRRAR